LLLGPIFARELVTLPRRGRFYFARAAFVGTLLVLSITAWLVLSEQRPVRGVGELARFGVLAFRFLAPLQLLATVFFGALAAASAVAVEKDRRTLDLLLLTKLNNAELVLGKLAASLAFVMAMLLGALPLFMLGMLWGGISPTQVAHAFAVCLVATLAAGSVGSTVALWREKTFQTLAITALLLVFWWAAGELVAAGVLGRSWAGTDCQTWAVAISPVRAVLEATHPWSPAPLVQGVRLSPVCWLWPACGRGILRMRPAPWEKPRRLGCGPKPYPTCRRGGWARAARARRTAVPDSTVLTKWASSGLRIVRRHRTLAWVIQRRPRPAHRQPPRRRRPWHAPEWPWGAGRRPQVPRGLVRRP
jgi:hypothetical protein